MEIIAPTITNLGVIRKDKVHHIRKIFLAKLAAIACERAAAISR